MSVQFFQTMMGRKFYESDFPRLVDSLKKIEKHMQHEESNVSFFVKINEGSITSFEQVSPALKILVKDLAGQTKSVRFQCLNLNDREITEIDEKDLLVMKHSGDIDSINPSSFVAASWKDVPARSVIKFIGE